MIIVRLRGGLGNQLFQAATGLAIAKRCKKELKFDLSWFRAYRYEHIYSLPRFALNPQKATDLEIRRTGRIALPVPLGSRLYYKYHDHIKKRSEAPFQTQPIVRERGVPFDAEVPTLHHDFVLDGFWQSEKYFIEQSQAIYDSFRLLEKPDSANEEFLHEVTERESVAIHVRRGDFFSNPEINKIHGVCDTGYFQRAVQAISERVKDPFFYFFSDDPNWVEQNLLRDRSVVVRHNKKDFEDLRLISSCKHQIISNSSFSWWGAWLNRKQDKTVIAPRSWYNPGYFDDRDILPTSWIKV